MSSSPRNTTGSMEMVRRGKRGDPSGPLVKDNI